MKQAIGIIVALGFSLYVMFLWGRLFVDVLLHPVRAFEFFVLPGVVVCVLVWLISLTRGRRNKADLNAQIARSIQKKSATEQLEISINEDNQWSGVAVEAARNNFKKKSLAAQVDAVAEVRAHRF